MKKNKELKRFTVSIPIENYRELSKYAERDGFIAPSQKARQYIIQSLILEKDYKNNYSEAQNASMVHV